MSKLIWDQKELIKDTLSHRKIEAEKVMAEFTEKGTVPRHLREQSNLVIRTILEGDVARVSDLLDQITAAKDINLT